MDEANDGLKQPAAGPPLVSIITVVKNGGETIERTIASVLEQDYDNIEYLVIDGGSTDNTPKIIEKYARDIAVVISETDAGISDAFNKGIRNSHGAFIGLLNSDDSYASGAISRAVDALASNPMAGFAFGHCALVSDSSLDTVNYGDASYRSRIKYRMPCVNHSTMIVRKSVYQQCGLFDTAYRYAMDYDFLLRMDAQGFRGHLIDEVQTVMRQGGLSERNWAAAYREVRDISRKHGASSSAAYSLYCLHLIRGLASQTLRGIGLKIFVHKFRAMRRRFLRF